MCLAVAGLLVAAGTQGLQTATANGDNRTLSFHHLHTGEDITVTFKREGRYDEAALKKLNWFMRDWRKEQSIEMDPQLFDLLWEAYRAVDGKQPIQVICGYRSPDTNAMLRRRSSGVAQASQHTLGHAMDFAIPGVSLEALRNVGLRLQRGGVGFYPTSGSPFVHMDVGSVRHWPRLSHDQLVKIFPDGRTVHVGTDGQPLKNYALALADIERRGGHVSGTSLAAAGRAGAASDQQIARAEMDNDGRMTPASGAGNLFARLFSRDEDETEAAPASLPAGVAPMPSPVATTRITARTEAAPTVPLPQARPASQTTVQIAAAMPLPRPAPGRVASPAFNPLAAGTFQTASADPEMTATIAAQATMAYASPVVSEPDPIRASGMGDSAGDRLARASAKLPDASNQEPPARTSAEIRSAIVAQRFQEPWLRAVMLTPNVTNYLTATAIGGFDPRNLASMMSKPAYALTAGFSAKPGDGLTSHRFTGHAVVFLASNTFFGRTAALAR